jgi:hypothetical protein
MTQVPMPGTRGRVYYDGQTGEGKTHKEAMRCLKRRLAEHVWRIMIADQRRQTLAASPGGHSGASTKSSAASTTPAADSSDKSLPEPATTQLTTKPEPVA